MSTVLLVEDDPDLRQMWTEVLTLRGHAVRSARSLDELGAVSVAEVDVAVVDWTLPDGSGEDAVASLRARGCTARILLTTGYDADQVPAGAVGASAVLRKPFRLRALTDAIGDLTNGNTS